MGVRNGGKRERHVYGSGSRETETGRGRERERRFSRGGEGESGENEVKGDDRGSLPCGTAKQSGEGSNEKRSPRREEIQLGFYITDTTVRRPTKYYVQLRNDKRYPGMMPLGGQISSGEGVEG